MGGWGSGSRSNRGYGKRKCEDALPLDIRRLHRADCLIPGKFFSWCWSIGGREYASIGAEAREDHVLLKYTHRKSESVEQKIPLDWTPCNYGGKRPWWRCPHCGRRCAVIYGAGKHFSCRVCYGLAYTSTCETDRDRLFSKADKLWKKIGAKQGAANPLPIFKPKGMHQKTWDRIRREIQTLEHQGWMDTGQMMGMEV
ncbi:hypothetical protein [Desulfocicer niacini]